MPERARLAPAPELGAYLHEEPIAGGRLLSYTCAPDARATARPVLRLTGLRVPGPPGPAFACGFWYALGGGAPFGRVGTLPWPYNTYRKVRWQPVRDGERTYCAALDLKFPLLAAWCEETRSWHGLLFEPLARVGDTHVPLFCTAYADGDARCLEVALAPDARVEVAAHAWFGLERRTERVRPPLAGAEFTISCAELEAADWPALLECAVGSPLLPRPAAPRGAREAFTAALDRAWRGLSRAEDTAHGALIHLLRRNGPGQLSAEFKHSHVTAELHAAELATRYAAAGSREAAWRRGIIGGWCFAPGRSIMREYRTGDAAGAVAMAHPPECWWQSTTRLGVDGMQAFTHHGLGFVGFPGGQATNARLLCEMYQATGDALVADFALATARWVLLRQRPDGAWPTTLPLQQNVRTKPVGQDQPCVAATAEAVRALLGAFGMDGNPTWLEAADRGLAFVNREASLFTCHGYLRDTAPDEPEGMTAECAVHANLDRARFGPPDDFLPWAQRWAWYGVQWTRPLAPDPRGAWVADGVGHTITPRVDVWSALLLAGAWARLAETTGEAWWGELAWRQAAACTALQEPDGGFAETWWYDYPDGLAPVPMESTFLALAFLDLARWFAPDWAPPECERRGGDFLQDAPARVEGPAGLSCAFRERRWREPHARLRRLLLRRARAGAPRSWAARALGFLRLFNGGEDALTCREIDGPGAYEILCGAPIHGDGAWRVPLAITRPPDRDALTGLVAELHGARDVTVEGDALVAVAEGGGRWRVRLESTGPVLATPDKRLDLTYAAHWPSGGENWCGALLFEPAEAGEGR